jgi:hypothetical protein
MKGNLNRATVPKKQPGRPLVCDTGIAASPGGCPIGSKGPCLNGSGTGDSVQAAVFATTHWSVVLTAGQEESPAASEALT